MSPPYGSLTEEHQGYNMVFMIQIHDGYDYHAMIENICRYIGTFISLNSKQSEWLMIKYFVWVTQDILRRERREERHSAGHHQLSSIPAHSSNGWSPPHSATGHTSYFRQFIQVYNEDNKDSHRSQVPQAFIRTQNIFSFGICFVCPLVKTLLKSSQKLRILCWNQSFCSLVSIDAIVTREPGPKLNFSQQ